MSRPDVGTRAPLHDQARVGLFVRHLQGVEPPRDSRDGVRGAGCWGANCPRSLGGRFDSHRPNRRPCVLIGQRFLVQPASRKEGGGAQAARSPEMQVTP